MATPTWITLGNANQTNQINSGAAANTFTGPQDISAGTNVLGQAFQTVPAQLFPGQMLRLTAAGIYSTTGTPNLTLGFYYGAAAGVALCATAATTTASGVANGTWYMNALSRVLTTGTSGTASTIGYAWGLSSSAGVITPMPVTSATGNTVTIDTSIAKLLTVAATWSASSISNAITCYHLTIEYLTEP